MVKLRTLSPRGHEFDPRHLSYGTSNLTHSFELSLTSVAPCSLRVFFV